MPTERNATEPGDWGFLKPGALWGFVLFYNGLVLALFLMLRDQDYFVKILLCSLGFLTLAFLLALRFSSSLRKLLVRPEFNNTAFLKKLHLSIGFWVLLPIVFLFLPNKILDIW